MLLRDILKHHMLAVGEVEAIAAMALVNGRSTGGGNRYEGLGPDGRTWSVNIGNGADRGVYGAWSAGHHGDIVQFATRGLFNGVFQDFLAWGRRRYGLQGEPLHDLQRVREQAERAKQARAQRDAERNEQRRRYALMILASPGNDRLARVYLAGRGLDVHVPLLRFGTAVDYDFAEPPFQRLPAMLAPVHRLADGAVMAVHRTFVRQDDAGVWRKAGVEKPKLSLGPVSGHVIPLLDGAGVPWPARLAQRDAKPEAVCMAEGIENALAGSLMFPGVRCAAFLFHGNLPKVAELLPRWINPVILMFDRDAKSGGRDDIRRSREMAIQRLLVDGRTVMVVAPSTRFKDFNDHLQALIREQSYKPNFTDVRQNLDWRVMLAEAEPATVGDPVALYWQRVTGGHFGTNRAPTGLRMHGALPAIERPDVAWPALLAPVMGEKGRPIGVLVAWLVQERGHWGLAPLLRPIRVLGSSHGVVPVTAPQRASSRAKLVVGLENALTLAHARPRQTVICVVDPTHATLCAPGVPSDVDAIDVLIENDDATLAPNLLAEVASHRLKALGMAVEIQRPWDEYTDIATMLRDVGGLAA